MRSSTGLWAELKRRNVFRVGLFYVVTAWLIIEVAETVLPLFDVPDGVLRVLETDFATSCLATDPSSVDGCSRT